MNTPFKNFFWIALLLLFIAAPAFGEYYEYTDRDGTVRFTDDPSVIPKDQAEVKTFESIQSEPYQEEMTNEESASEVSAGDTDAVEEDAKGVNTSLSGADWENLDEMSAMRKALRQEYDALQAEKNALGPLPTRETEILVREEYNSKVAELNRKIKEYDKRSREFDAKMKAYNTQMGKK